MSEMFVKEHCYHMFYHEFSCRFGLMLIPYTVSLSFLSPYNSQILDGCIYVFFFRILRRQKLDASL